MIKVEIQEKDFNHQHEIDNLRADRQDIGAVVSFIGTVRDINAGDMVSALTLEHYPQMTQKILHKIADDAKNRWQITGLTIIHRVGKLYPRDNIVLVIVASKHRKDAFAACEFVMDFLKTEAPFWKKEQTKDGEHWVESRQSDLDNLNKWKDGE